MRKGHFKVRLGFTLLELGVTLAIFSVLAVLIFPAVKGSMAKGRGAACLSNLKQLGVGWMAYAGDRDGRLASVGWRNTSDNAANPGIRDYVGLPLSLSGGNWQVATVFTCPELQSNPATKTEEVLFRTYSVNQLATDVYSGAIPAGLKRRLGQINRPSQFAVAMDGLYDAGRAANDRYSLSVRNFGGTNQSLIQSPHAQKTSVLFADGHVAMVEREQILDTSATSVFWRDSN